MKTITNKHRQFLNELRASGQVNMFASGPTLRKHFNLTREESEAIFLSWIDEQK